MTLNAFAPVRALILFAVLAVPVSAPRAQAPQTPSAAAATGLMPLDLNTGKIDTTPLAQTDPITLEAFDPQTPPQTVEGTLVAVNTEGQFATVHSKRHGDVKLGLPPDAYVSRNGDEASISDMKPGDRIWATVETAHGVRAIRIVFAPPANPLVSWIGIPVLLILAFILWWTGRGLDTEQQRPAAAKA